MIEVVFDTINVIASLVVFGIIVFKLLITPDKFTIVESGGMGLMAAGCMMLIGPITFKPSPFDGWALTLFLTGAATYFVGRITRHRFANWQMRRQARHSMREHR